jgi:hypothetical protein
MAGVRNAYLYAPTKEKVFCITGPELDQENIGIIVILVRVLYGLKSSNAAWRKKVPKHSPTWLLCPVMPKRMYGSDLRFTKEQKRKYTNIY